MFDEDLLKEMRQEASWENSLTSWMESKGRKEGTAEEEKESLLGLIDDALRPAKEAETKDQDLLRPPKQEEPKKDSIGFKDMAIATEAHMERPKRERVADRSKQAEKTRDLDKWLNNMNTLDFPGVDTKKEEEVVLDPFGEGSLGSVLEELGSINVLNDSDLDGVPDSEDCEPFNPMKQGPEHNNPPEIKPQQPQNSNDNDRFWLKNQIKIYVPSTNANDEKISEEAFRRRIRNTQREFTDRFGGSTTVEGVGTWMNDNTMVREDVAVVSIHMTPEDWEEKKEMIFEWVKKKQEKWGQDAVSLEHENNLTFVE